MVGAPSAGRRRIFAGRGMTKFCTFPEMRSSLRASAAAGMETQITLKPDAARELADAIDLVIEFQETMKKAQSAARDFIEEQAVDLVADRMRFKKQVEAARRREFLIGMAFIVAGGVCAVLWGWF